MLPAQFEVSQSEHTTELRRSEACLPALIRGKLAVRKILALSKTDAMLGLRSH